MPKPSFYFLLITLLSFSLIACNNKQDIQSFELVSDLLPKQSQGNEPGWQVLVKDKQLELLMNYNQDKYVFNELTTAIKDNTWIITSSQPINLGLTYIQETCLDDMTAMPYPWKVTLETEQRKLLGCGGTTQEVLQGSWKVIKINQTSLLEDSEITLSFDSNQVAGFAGCNNFMTSYQLTGEGISFNHPASTLKACQPELMQQETQFLQQLNKTNHLTFNPKNELVLTGKNNQQILAIQN